MDFIVFVVIVDVDELIFKLIVIEFGFLMGVVIMFID